MESTNNAQTLSVQDLQNLLVIVDLACSRGAVRATELSTVGQLYDKTQAFIKAHNGMGALMVEGD